MKTENEKSPYVEFAYQYNEDPHQFKLRNPRLGWSKCFFRNLKLAVCSIAIYCINNDGVDFPSKEREKLTAIKRRIFRNIIDFRIKLKITNETILHKELTFDPLKTIPKLWKLKLMINVVDVFHKINEQHDLLPNDTEFDLRCKRLMSLSKVHDLNDLLISQDCAFFKIRIHNVIHHLGKHKDLYVSLNNQREYPPNFLPYKQKPRRYYKKIIDCNKFIKSIKPNDAVRLRTLLKTFRPKFSLIKIDNSGKQKHRSKTEIKKFKKQQQNNKRKSKTN